MSLIEKDRYLVVSCNYENKIIDSQKSNRIKKGKRLTKKQYLLNKIPKHKFNCSPHNKKQKLKKHACVLKRSRQKKMDLSLKSIYQLKITPIKKISAKKNCLCGKVQMRNDNPYRYMQCWNCEGNKCYECHEEYCQGKSFSYCAMCDEIIDPTDCKSSVRVPIEHEILFSRSFKNNQIRKNIPQFVCVGCSLDFKNVLKKCSVCHKINHCSMTMKKHQYNIIQFNFLKGFSRLNFKGYQYFDFYPSDIYFSDYYDCLFLSYYKNLPCVHENKTDTQSIGKIITLDTNLPSDHYLKPFQQALRENPHETNHVCHDCIRDIYYYHIDLNQYIIPYLECTHQYNQCSGCLEFLPIKPQRATLNQNKIHSLYHLIQEDGDLKMINIDNNTVITIPDEMYDLPPLYCKIIKYLDIKTQMKYLPWIQTLSSDEMIKFMMKKKYVYGYIFCSNCYPQEKDGFIITQMKNSDFNQKYQLLF